MSWLVDHRTDPVAIHVMPVDDLRDHVATERCWCQPLEQDEDEIDIENVATRTVLVHHAMDDRSSYAPEGGPRALH